MHLNTIIKHDILHYIYSNNKIIYKHNNIIIINDCSILHVYMLSEGVNNDSQKKNYYCKLEDNSV